MHSVLLNLYVSLNLENLKVYQNYNIFVIITDDNSTQVCELRERLCYEIAEREFSEKHQHDCNCLQACDQIDYDIEFRESHFVTYAEAKVPFNGEG